jgi:hypothetical protein
MTAIGRFAATCQFGGAEWIFISSQNVEAWHPLPGAPLRFRLRFVATLRLRLGSGSGLSSAGFHEKAVNQKLKFTSTRIPWVLWFMGLELIVR